MDFDLKPLIWIGAILGLVPGALIGAGITYLVMR